MPSRNGWRYDRQNDRLEVQVASQVVGYFPGRGSNYSPMGKAFYADRTNGNDNYNGLSPQTAKKTVNAALGLCTTNKNDYVFVLESKDEDETAVTTTKERVHLIGISNPQCAFGVVFRATSDTEDALYCDQAGFGYSEIAGISFGGGATGKGGIGLAQTCGLWVHHCTFGNSFCGDTPDYGIYRTCQANPEHLLIEDNFFFGDQAYGNGKLAEEAIQLTGATPPKSPIIRRNTFMGIGGAACNISATGGVITDNFFMIPDAETGEAITIDADGISYSLGCLIAGNLAANGMLNTGYTYNPYRDLQTNTYNAWSMNYRGNSVIEPVGV